MTYRNWISFCGVAFILGFSAGWAVTGQHWNEFLTSYLPSLATLVAAFFGASFAFQFQSEKEKKEEVRRNIVNGNSAIFVLGLMRSQLIDYAEQTINPVRSNPLRYIAMRATNKIETVGPINAEGLYFLLGSENPTLLSEVMREQGRYRSAINAINLRSKIHIEEIQPQLEGAGFKQGGSYTAADIEKMIGTRLFQTIDQSTKDVVELVDMAIVSIKKMADALSDSLKKEYPNEKVVYLA